mmetsp:Transcript_16652/g.41209  ORF Transcript_16652/g.41209 Transcript_16652/m.41209 type:complete len:112 (+) Transcript_16652:3283-3618(+)
MSGTDPPDEGATQYRPQERQLPVFLEDLEVLLDRSPPIGGLFLVPTSTSSRAVKMMTLLQKIPPCGEAAVRRPLRRRRRRAAQPRTSWTLTRPRAFLMMMGLVAIDLRELT